MLSKVKRLLRQAAAHRVRLRHGVDRYDRELDARGCSCPVPVLKTRRALEELGAGQVLHVVATDPGSLVNVKALASQRGAALVEAFEAGDEFHFILKKSETSQETKSSQ